MINGLKYFTDVTESLTAVCVLLGLLFAYAFLSFGSKGRLALRIGAGAGVVLAFAVSIIRQATKWWDKTGGTGSWNVRTFTVSTLALLCFYLLLLNPLQKKLGKAYETVVGIVAGILAFTLAFYAFPEVFGYPFAFNLSGDSILSTAFFYRLIGYILGLILCFLLFLAAERTGRKTGLGVLRPVLCLALLVNGVQQVIKALQVLYSKRVVSGHALFQVIRFSSNHSNLFIYLILAVAAVLPVMLWARSFRVNEPYENPAQHRKIRAKWRSIRRWSGALAACFLMAVISLTALTAAANQEVELSPTEESEVRGENVYVPLSQVDDGHLHRFAYTTEDGVNVRFIVIKKPNATAYGIGLDACDICGETGYYERNGQVVCNLCDVVMNVNTIGFKGGCNPIVIDYSIQNGYIVVPISTLEEHKVEFTR